MRAAFTDFALDRDYAKAVGQHRERVLDLVRAMLRSGRLTDPRAKGAAPSEDVEIRGLCPAELAAPLRGRTRGDQRRRLERAKAATALAALERDVILQSSSTSQRQRSRMAAEYRAAIRAGTHVDHTWHFTVAVPPEWMLPPRPMSLAPDDLGRLSDEHYRRAVLFWLGGLADTGALRPVVARPEPSGDALRDAALYVSWRERLPLCGDEVESEQLTPRPERFNPAVAEQMVADLEHWVRERQPAGSPDRPPDATSNGAAAGSIVPAPATANDAVIAWDRTLGDVSAAVAADPGAFAGEVKWLETYYAEAEVRRRRAAVDAGDEDQLASAHQLGSVAEGTDTREWRLSAALVDLRTHPPDLSRTAREDPGPLARRVLLLVCLLTDRAVGGYGLGTDLAGLPYGARWAIAPEELLRGRVHWPLLVRQALIVHGQAARSTPSRGAASSAVPATPSSAPTEPRTCQDVVLEFIDAASGVLPAHVTGAIAELKGEVRRPELPSGSESRHGVQNLVKIVLPRLLSEAMLLAGDDGLRHTLHLRLQRALDIAQELAESLDGITPERTVNLEKRALKRGPWIDIQERLQTAMWQIWPLLDLSVQAARGSVEESKAAAVMDLEAMVERVVAALQSRAGPESSDAADPQRPQRPVPKEIFLRVAIRKYHVSDTTIRDAVRAGKLKNLRSHAAAKNSPLILDENQIAARWPLRGT